MGCKGGSSLAEKALIEIATGLVTNVIEIEDGADWSPPPGHELKDAEGLDNIGDIWDGIKFVSKLQPVTPDWRALWLSASTDAAKLRIIARRLGLED